MYTATGATLRFLTVPAVLPPCAAGILLGWISWLSGYPALFFPVSVFGLAWLWGAARSRLAAFTLFLGYYLASLADIIPVAQDYFGQGLVTGILMWIAAAAILALPFGLLHGDRHKPARFAAALLITALPPIGVMGWLSPLLAAGVLFPGMGLAGLAAMLATLSAATLAPSMSLPVKLAAVPAILIATLAADMAAPSRMPDHEWFGQHTAMGGYPDDLMGHIERHQDLMRMAREGVEEGAKLVLFPENIAGDWDRTINAAWSGVAELARQQGATVLIGTSITMLNGSRMNSLTAIGADSFQAHARIPMPAAMWRPWTRNGYAADIASSGLAKVQGRTVAITICHEDMLIWPLVWSFASGEPEAILSAGNNWFGNPSASRIQRTAIEMQARLYGVPLVRAVNLAEDRRSIR